MHLCMRGTRLAKVDCTPAIATSHTDNLLSRRTPASKRERCYSAEADAPKHKSVEELIQMTHRGGWWSKYVTKFKPTDFNAVVESESRVLRFR